MKEVVDRLSSVRVKDFTIVILCVVTVYLLRARETFVLRPEWRVDSEVKMPNKDQAHDEILPQPIITDIEGDGIKEVVLITNDLQLQISAMPPKTSSSVLPVMEVKRKIQLSHTFTEEGKKTFPVAMTTGFLHSNESSPAEVRKQVIVIATNDWNVYCFDHTLNQLWSVTLLDLGQSRKQYYVKAMSVTVTSHSHHRNGQGMVIVGGSFGHKLHSQKVDKFRSGTMWQSFSAMTDDTMKQAEDTAVHFSTFALSGNNGSILWHHLPGDFEQSDDDALWKAHHWKLALKREQHHSGEVHWSQYVKHLTRHLPHRWDGIYDTRIYVARIKRTHSGDRIKPETSTLDDIIDMDTYSSHHLVGTEQTNNPNVVIIHNHNGIEVLNLANGRPVTRLTLPSDKSTYADVDDDGSIDEVKIVWHQKDKNCEAVVSSIHPVNRLVFSESVCKPATWSNAISSSFISTPEGSEDLRLSVAPQVIKSVTRRAGILNHLSGHTLSSNKKHSDSIFLTSNGRLTSYGSSGELNWNVRISSTWSDISHVSEESLYKDSEIGRVYHQLFKPSMQIIAPRVAGKKTAVLVSGWNHMSIIDLRDGYVVGEHSLPCQPISPPVFGDYNNDGWTDVIVSCNIGYLGFGIEHQYNFLYTVMMGFGGILGVWILIWCCTPEHMEDYRDDLSDL